MKIYPEETLSPLQKAIFIATQAHLGQADKDNKPYILHPIAVMNKLYEEGIREESLLCTAILHDVLEDTKWTYEDLKSVFCVLNAPIEILSIPDYVESLTHVTGPLNYRESYMQYVSNIKKYTPHLIPIKLADIWHNSLPERQSNFTKQSIQKRMDKYAEAKKILLG